MTAPAWFRLLRRCRHAIDARHAPVALAATLLCLRNSASGALQSAVVAAARRRRRAEAPIFVVGHWRSGTSWLHELLTLDPRHTSPTTYQCFAPSHFLLSEFAMRRIAPLFAAPARPMDAMAVNWQSPQEDEFALMNLGQPSPYLRFACPDGAWTAADDLSLASMTPEELARWKDTLRRFLTAVSQRNRGRLVLKSPPHTARVRVLLDMFPAARFVHVVRDPYEVFASTRKMWRAMCGAHALGEPSFDGLDDFVFETFLSMHAAFGDARRAIPPRQLAGVRYEDLVRDPEGTLRGVYEQLELGDVEAVIPPLRRHLQATAAYRPAAHDLPPDLRQQITRRWRAAIVDQGYALQ